MVGYTVLFHLCKILKNANISALIESRSVTTDLEAGVGCE